MSWKFKGNIVTEENTPDGAVGFVYKIVHIPTGKFYIGKKSLNQVRRLKPLKGKVRKRVVRKASDWEKYYSSNEWIKNEVKEGRGEDFEREIILVSLKNHLHIGKFGGNSNWMYYQTHNQ